MERPGTDRIISGGWPVEKLMKSRTPICRREQRSKWHPSPGLLPLAPPLLRMKTKSCSNHIQCINLHTQHVVWDPPSKVINTLCSSVVSPFFLPAGAEAGSIFPVAGSMSPLFSRCVMDGSWALDWCHQYLAWYTHRSLLQPPPALF